MEEMVLCVRDEVVVAEIDVFLDDVMLTLARCE